MYFRLFLGVLCFIIFLCYSPNLARVFITLNHKSLPNPIPHSLLAQFNPREDLRRRLARNPREDFPPNVFAPRAGSAQERCFSIENASLNLAHRWSIGIDLCSRSQTSRGFLSRSITNHLRNQIPHHLLAQPTRGRLLPNPSLIHRH